MLHDKIAKMTKARNWSLSNELCTKIFQNATSLLTYIIILKTEYCKLNSTINNKIKKLKEKNSLKANYFLQSGAELLLRRSTNFNFNENNKQHAQEFSISTPLHRMQTKIT